MKKEIMLDDIFLPLLQITWKSISLKYVENLPF